VEVDVRLSKDRIPIVIHDETVDRTTNGSGSVSEMCAHEICELDAVGGEKVPMLDDVLQFIKTADINLIIEIKEVGIEDIVIDSIKNNKMEDHVIVSSFFHPSVLNLKRAEPGIKTGVIFSSLPVRAWMLAINANADIMFPKLIRTTGDLVRGAHEHGIAVYPWIVNTREDFLSAAEMGVDGIVSDHPCTVRSFMK
jgi:glycerophosphoryl diester phosphodiesterase